MKEIKAKIIKSPIQDIMPLAYFETSLSDKTSENQNIIRINNFIYLNNDEHLTYYADQDCYNQSYNKSEYVSKNIFLQIKVNIIENDIIIDAYLKNYIYSDPKYIHNIVILIKISGKYLAVIWVFNKNNERYYDRKVHIVIPNQAKYSTNYIMLFNDAFDFNYTYDLHNNGNKTDILIKKNHLYSTHTVIETLTSDKRFMYPFNFIDQFNEGDGIEIFPLD